jgi:phosphoglycerate dehydrogenase-like enzyme
MHRAQIAQELEERFEVVFVPEKQHDWDSALHGATIVFGWPDPHALFRSGVLFHQLPSSGYDAYAATFPDRRTDFALANARGVCARAVAEHAISMMFAFARGVHVHDRQRREHIWRRMERYDLIFGKTLCVIGMGAIGTSLAHMGKALGMCVLAVTRSGQAVGCADRTFALHNLDSALSEADHVVITLPALPGNAALFTAAEFAWMKRGSYLYSVGRGSHIDYAALRRALRDGPLRGAGLDVFAEEPLPADDPLWDEPNVLISPHAGGRFAGEYDALVALFLRNVRRFLAHEPVENVVLGTAVPLR